MTPGITYSFSIVAVNAKGSSPWSTPAWLEDQATKSLAPSGVIATKGLGQVNVTWTAPTNDGGAAVTYTVEEETNGGGWSPVATGLSSTNYTYTAVTAGNTYSFSIVAVNSKGSSPWSSAGWVYYS